MRQTQLVRVPKRYGQELAKFVDRNGISWDAVEGTEFNVSSLYAHVKAFTDMRLAKIPASAMTVGLRGQCEAYGGVVYILRFFDDNIGAMYCVTHTLTVEEFVDAKSLKGFVWKEMGKPERDWESDDVFNVITVTAPQVDEGYVATLLGCGNDPEAMSTWGKMRTKRHFGFYHRSLVQVLCDEKCAYHEQKVLLAALNVAVEQLLNQSLKRVRDSIIRLSRSGMSDVQAEQDFAQERNRVLVYSSALISSGLVKRANAAESAEISRRYADEIGLSDLCRELMEKLRYGGELLERVERMRMAEALAQQQTLMKRQEQNIARNMKILALLGVVFGYLGSNVLLPDFVKSSALFGWGVLLFTVLAVFYLLRQARVSA